MLTEHTIIKIPTQQMPHVKSNENFLPKLSEKKRKKRYPNTLPKKMVDLAKPISD